MRFSSFRGVFLVLLGVAWCTACKGPAAPEVDASVPDAAANPDCTRGEPDCASLVIGEESYARSVTAEEVLRTDVTGYGDIQSPDEFGRRLRAITERQRTGEILLQINPLLRRLTQEPSGDYATQLGTLLADVLALAQEIVDTGGTVRFQLTCATPIWLSDTPFPHDTTTGANRASDQPVYACSPPNDAAEWTRIVRAVAELFTPMADRVAFTVGGEPETYFAGDRDQLFAWYRSTVEGVRASTRGAEMRVGGITVAFHRTSDLRKTQPVETGGAVTFTEVDYGEPLTQSWIRYCGENGLPIDLVTIHQFAGSPTPSVGTFWSHARRDITAWLEESGFDPATVELGIEDWPNWVPYPSNDTEYFAAHMIAGVLSMLDLSLRGGMQVRPLQAFLYDYGFRPEGRFLAGFTGVPGMTNEQWIIEPVYNADSLMAEVRGVVTPVRSDDPFVHAVAAQDGETWTLLVSNFIPLELERDPLYDTYHQRPIAANHFIEEDVSDVDYDRAALARFFGGRAPSDVELADALFADPSPITFDDLGWPPLIQEQWRTAQRIGQLARRKRSTPTTALVDLVGIASGRHRVEHFVVDVNHANTYADRASIDGRLASARGGGAAALEAEIRAINAEYDAVTGLVADEVVEVAESPHFVFAMQPGSVHLLRITPAP